MPIFKKISFFVSGLGPYLTSSRKLQFRVASAYFLLGSILMRCSVHTDREKVSTKASYYTDKHLKRRILQLVDTRTCSTGTPGPSNGAVLYCFALQLSLCLPLPCQNVVTQNCHYTSWWTHARVQPGLPDPQMVMCSIALHPSSASAFHFHASKSFIPQ